MAYALEIMALECLKNQELDGDEIILKLNDKVIFHWEDTGYRWAAELKLEDWTNYYNFRDNTLRTMNGDVKPAAYEDFGFVLTGLTEPTTIELIESDERNLFRGADDELGRFTVDERNAAQTAQQYDFTGEGAHYRITFAVVAQ